MGRTLKFDVSLPARIGYLLFFFEPSSGNVRQGYGNAGECSCVLTHVSLDWL